MLYEFVLQVDQKQVEQEMEKLNAAGLFHLYYEQPIEIEKVQNGYSYTQLENQIVDLKIYADETEEQGLPASYLSMISEVTGIPVTRIPYQKIDNNWDFELEDIDLGNGWMIRYSDQSYGEEKQVLQFNPQAAFGTGLHETTQDCLKFILDEDFTGKQVLDLGTGSGILTVAASLKQAEKVVAIDFEPTEREVMHNVQLNQLNNQVTALQKDLINGDFLIQEDYDWIFINIGADETVQIVNKHQLFDKSRNFIISGLVEWYLEPVMNTLEEKGFEAVKKYQSNEWVTIYFSEKS